MAINSTTVTDGYQTDWMKRLQQGKITSAVYGSAIFFTSQTSYKGEHRVAVYKYPESDRVEYARQGRDEFDITLTAYVVGGFSKGDDDVPKNRYIQYDYRRDKIMRILHAGGEIRVVHPYLGSMNCQIRSYTVDETSAETNICAITMNLSRVLRGAEDTAHLLTSDLNATLRKESWAIEKEIAKTIDNSIKTAKSFSKWKTFLGSAVYYGTKARSSIAKTMSQAMKIMDRLIKQVNKVRIVGASFLEFKRSMTTIRALQEELIQSAAGTIGVFAALLKPGYNPFGKWPMGPVQSWKMFKEYTAMATADVFTDNEKTWYAHQSADGVLPANYYGMIMQRSVNKLSTLYGTQVASTMPYANISDMREAQLTLSLQIDNILQVEDLTHTERDSWRALKAAMVATIEGKIRGFRDLKVTPIVTQPMLVNVYSATGVLDSVDMSANNNLTTNMNPLFCKSGVEVSVVTYG